MKFITAFRRLPQWAKLLIGGYLVIGVIISVVTEQQRATDPPTPSPVSTPTAVSATTGITEPHVARGYCWAYLRQRPLKSLQIDRDVTPATLVNNGGTIEWRYLGSASYMGASGIVGRVYRCHLTQQGDLLLLEWVQ